MSLFTIRVNNVGLFAWSQIQCLSSIPHQVCIVSVMSDSHSNNAALCLSLSPRPSLLCHLTMLICPHASLLCVACCKGCRHSNVFHVAVINMLIFLISHLKPAVYFSFTHPLPMFFPSPSYKHTHKHTPKVCVSFCTIPQYNYTRTTWIWRYQILNGPSWKCNKALA